MNALLGALPLPSQKVVFDSLCFNYAVTTQLFLMVLDMFLGYSLD